MAYKVFLSHSSVDTKWVRSIAINAEQVGVEVYLYEHDPQPGRLVADKVEAAIQSCDALVVLLTRNSESSPYVQQEVGYAKALKKVIIPLVQPGVSKEKLAMLQGIEYIRFDFQNPQPGLATLLEYLQKAKLGKEESQALLAVGALVETAAHAKLSPAEIEILRNVPSDGTILLDEYEQGGPFLRFGLTMAPPDLNHYDPAAAAHYLDAFESLQARGLLRHEGGVLYRLTGRGFDLRKGLLEDQSVGGADPPRRTFYVGDR
jgi:nucleoside 2-deoxyribosyltransferase